MAGTRSWVRYDDPAAGAVVSTISPMLPDMPAEDALKALDEREVRLLALQMAMDLHKGMNTNVQQVLAAAADFAAYLKGC